MNAITPLVWTGNGVRYLDQTKLPSDEVYVEIESVEQLAEAIRTLSIRGAPLIGIAAAYGVTLALWKADHGQLKSVFERAVALFAGTRPTAVNLFVALDRMKRVFAELSGQPAEVIKERMLEEARSLHAEDEQMCEKIAEFGSGILPKGCRVLTHCNTGALATGGRGTALGIIAAAWEHGHLRHVYIGETRPLFQGSRLTAWELGKLGIPSTLLTDSSAAFLFQQGLVDIVVVGADRIAANGDVANKVGTYGLAVLAHHHGIPFLVAAPSTSIDRATPSGKTIPIEQRNAIEVTAVGGTRVAPEGVAVYSPAFDITPHELITAIITERGVHHAPYVKSLECIPDPVSSEP